MDNERLVRKGQLAESKAELNQLEALAENSIINIRMKLDIMAESVCDLDLPTAAAEFNQLLEYYHKAVKLQAKIDKLHELLGE